MARPSKYNYQTSAKLVNFIRDGLTIKDACYGAGISTDTFNRWRTRYPEFGKAVQEATEGQWQNAEALAKYHYRAYRRKSIPPVQNYPSEHRRGLKTRLMTPEGHFTELQCPQFYAGLPIRYSTLDDWSDTGPFIDASTGRVKWVKDGKLHGCAIEVWQEKHGYAASPLIFESF